MTTTTQCNNHSHLLLFYSEHMWVFPISKGREILKSGRNISHMDGVSMNALALVHYCDSPQQCVCESGVWVVLQLTT